MTTALQTKSLWDAIVREPLELAKAQPHQILLSTGSVALMGQFAGASGIVHPFVGYLIAIGVEWAYLRGLASDSRAPTVWGAILNWSAFIVVVLWGVLWVAGFTGAINAHDGGWLLAFAHVVPIAWLSLCAAQTHRSAMIAETQMLQEAKNAQSKLDAEQEERDREHRRKVEEAQHLFDIEQAAKDRELARWKDAYALKQGMKMPVQNAGRKMRTNANRDAINADDKICPKCQIVLAHAQWLAARRWGHCSSCKES